MDLWSIVTTQLIRVSIWMTYTCQVSLFWKTWLPSTWEQKPRFSSRFFTPRRAEGRCSMMVADPLLPTTLPHLYLSLEGRNFHHGLWEHLYSLPHSFTCWYIFLFLPLYLCLFILSPSGHVLSLALFFSFSVSFCLCPLHHYHCPAGKDNWCPLRITHVPKR